VDFRHIKGGTFQGGQAVVSYLWWEGGGGKKKHLLEPTLNLHMEVYREKRIFNLWQGRKGHLHLRGGRRGEEETPNLWKGDRDMNHSRGGNLCVQRGGGKERMSLLRRAPPPFSKEADSCHRREKRMPGEEETACFGGGFYS